MAAHGYSHFPSSKSSSEDRASTCIYTQKPDHRCLLD